MITFNRSFEQINEETLHLLLDSETPEGLHLEYKTQIDNNTSLVEEVVAFANSHGGDLFIGIREENGRPVEIIGLDDSNPDALILKYSSIISGNSDPQLTNIRLQAIPLRNGRVVIHIRVPRSWIGPHMVKNYKFPLRTSAGKIPANTAELRRLFNSGYNFLEKYERFRVQRVDKVVNTYGIPTPFAMLHFVPVSAFDIGNSYPIIENRTNLDLSIPDGNVNNPIANAHGLYCRAYDNELVGHNQFFRNGVIEQVSNFAFRNRDSKPKEKLDFLLTKNFERNLKESITIQLKNCMILGMSDPIYLFVNLVGVKGVIGSFDKHTNWLDEELFQLPEILIEAGNQLTVDQSIDSIINILWNAFGFWERPR